MKYYVYAFTQGVGPGQHHDYALTSCSNPVTLYERAQTAGRVVHSVTEITEFQFNEVRITERTNNTPTKI